MEHNSTVFPNSVFLRHMKTPCMSLFKIKRKLKVKAGIHNFLVNTLIENDHLGPVVQSLVSANHWLRGIKTYRFPWYLHWLALTMLRATRAWVIRVLRRSVVSD